MATDDKKRQHWNQHVERWQKSGLTQRAYCAREGLALSTFDYWRRQARRQESQARPAEATPLTLIPATLARGDIRLTSPGGWQVTLPATLARDTLVPLLAQLP